MKITINNTLSEIEEGKSVKDLIDRIYESQGGIAVAINGKIVRKDTWAAHLIAENDDIVIIKAAYGG